MEKMVQGKKHTSKKMDTLCNLNKILHDKTLNKLINSTNSVINYKLMISIVFFFIIFLNIILIHCLWFNCFKNNHVLIQFSNHRFWVWYWCVTIFFNSFSMHWSMLWVFIPFIPHIFVYFLLCFDWYCRLYIFWYIKNIFYTIFFFNFYF